MNTFLATGVSTFFINSNPTFINHPKNLTRNSPDYIILDGWVFNYFTLTEELFANYAKN